FAERNLLREARQLDEGVCNSKDVVGCSFQERNSTVAPPQCELVLSSLIPVSAVQPPPLCEIWTDAEIVDAICRAGPTDPDYNALQDSVMSPGPRSSNPKLAKYSVEGIRTTQGNHPQPS
ncbi:uncharacterized protein VP01_8760g1, partial [Puccinia sorghi]